VSSATNPGSVPNAFKAFPEPFTALKTSRLPFEVRSPKWGHAYCNLALGCYSGAVRFGVFAVAVVLSGLVLGCDWLSGRDPAVAGDNGRVNQATARKMDVPYCPGGDRDKGCLLGTNCRITEKNCQVCQCVELDK
jgi:hypothetical protein